MKNKVNRVRWAILHHSAVRISVQPNQFWPINNYHKEKWHFKSSLSLYGGYHFLIEADGKVKQYRAVSEEAAHCIGMNRKSIGICIAGNFSKEYPTSAQKTALKGLLVGLMNKYSIPADHIVPHRHFSNTQCFGTNLKDNFAQDLITKDASDNVKIMLLKKQISIMSQLLKVYTKLLSLFKVGRSD